MLNFAGVVTIQWLWKRLSFVTRKHMLKQLVVRCEDISSPHRNKANVAKMLKISKSWKTVYAIIFSELQQLLGRFENSKLKFKRKNVIIQGENVTKILSLNLQQLRKKNLDFFFFFFLLFRAAPATYRGSQVRGLIGATAAGLYHSHSNAGSEPHLWSTPQLKATPDPRPSEQGQGSNPQPHASQSDSFLLPHNGNSEPGIF